MSRSGNGKISIVPKAFLDTNILIYQLDKRDPVKRRKCRELVRVLVANQEAVISTQILQEFYVACTTKLRIKPLLAKAIIHSFTHMETVAVGTDMINDAIDTSIQYGISFWDSLVIVTAESAKCRTLFSEDLNNGQVIRGVKITNPFA